MVSVPFRGSCSEIEEVPSDALYSRNSFPSPFGVRVLKYLEEH